MDEITSTLAGRLNVQLSQTVVTRAQFNGIVARLYATGILMREESKAETRLYDDALAIDEILVDYFDLAGFRLVHNKDGRYFRLYPPRTLEGEGDEDARRLRSGISRHFAAYLLTLRYLYKTAWEEGALNDEFERPATLPEIKQTMVALLGVDMPTAATTRQGIYRELRALRLVRLSPGIETEADDAIIAVRRTILDFVTESQLLAARQMAEARKAAEAPQSLASGEDEIEEGTDAESVSDLGDSGPGAIDPYTGESSMQ